MKNFYIIFAAAMLLASCSSAESEDSFVEVRQRAQLAASQVLAADSAELIVLQDCILRAKSVQSEYMVLGDTASADTFDAVFRRCIVQQNERLANELFNRSTDNKR